MIESFGVNNDDIGKWTGICAGSFSFCQFLTAITWGRASDRFGRKRTILAGLFCTMITSLMFGFSTTLSSALICRAFAGLGGGNGGIIRTATAELVPQKHLQPRAFSIMPLVWTVGSMIGPAIGGIMANPAHKYSQYFGSSSFFLRYPYLAPNLAACCLFVPAIAAGVLFLKETLHTSQNEKDIGLYLGQALLRPCRRERDHGQCRSSRSVSDFNQQGAYHGVDERLIENSRASDSPKTHEPPGQPQKFTWKLVFTSQSQINLLQYGLLAMHSVAYDQLLPVLMHHPRSSKVSTSQGWQKMFLFTDGFAMDSSRIGLLLMLNGIAGMVLQFLVFPPVVKKFGVLPCLRICAVAFFLLYSLVPFAALIRSPTAREATLLAIMIFKTSLTVFAWPCSTILLTNSAASPAVLGTLNGVATSTAAIGRTLGPAIGGAMFTVGLSKGSIVLPWLVIAMIAVIGMIPLFWLRTIPPFAERSEEAIQRHVTEDLRVEDEETEPLMASSNLGKDGSKP